MVDQQAAALPVTSAKRLGELDMLRGFALLGVLIANFVWFSFGNNSATEAQTAGFLADSANVAAISFTEIFVADKANTLFAFLFGVGFWVQMERLEASGAAFRKIYLRRLFVLLVFGLINLYLIWPWDILNVYAITGLALFALRRLPARVMLGVGLLIALLGRPVGKGLSDLSGLAGPAHEAAFSTEAILARQDAWVNGTYADWIQASAHLVFYDWVANGLVVAWILYALGRFLVGAWVARQGWLQRASDLLPVMRKLFYISMPLGLVLEICSFLTGQSQIVAAPGWLHQAIHMIGVPVLDIGYATGLILLFHSARWNGLARLFAPVGRMALTNYVVQGVFIGLVLYGFHGGLGLAGQIEPKVVLPLCLVFYALQMVVSHWWLRRYRFGPLEWLWRALTYGEPPAMRQALV